MSIRLLLIDDDPKLPSLLQAFFLDHDVVLTHAVDGMRGLELLSRESFDGVLLDVSMPVMNGFEVLKKLRAKHNLPVIMLTARGDETDRVVGLEMGADDYVPKPFAPRELLARVRAVMRRSQALTPSDSLSAGRVRVALPSRRAWVAETLVELTGLEFDLLVALLRRKGRVLSRETLLEEAGRGEFVVTDRTVDVHVSHLRQKLLDTDAQLIKTIRGIGYMLSDGE